jgi:hypothetical protein
MIQFYKPNPKNTGTGCSFNFAAKDDCIYINLIKQSSWDESKKRGSFSGNAQNPKMSASVKISSTEVGDIISAMRRNSEFNGFHDSPKQVTRIKFSPYNRPSKDNPTQISQVGFSLSVSKESKENAQDKTSFLIGFTFGEAIKLESYFALTLARIFDKAIREVDNKSAAAPQAAPQKKEEPPKQEAAADDDLW